MNTIDCNRALQLAGQSNLSGEVLAAQWHVHHCPKCQRMLSDIWIQVAVLNDRRALEGLLGIELEETICQKEERVITWLEHATHQIVAVAINLSAPLTPLIPKARMATLGEAELLSDSVIRQEVDRTPDGSIEWKITFIVDSADPAYCTAEVQVNLFDRWELAGIEIFLTWDGKQLRKQTNGSGQVRFHHIPVESLGQINVILHLPQAPINTKGAQ